MNSISLVMAYRGGPGGYGGLLLRRNFKTRAKRAAVRIVQSIALALISKDSSTLR